MKTAVVFSGNTRTFFMPLRENPNFRVCDVLIANVVNPTNADVYISTDTENFYLDGIQYFFTSDINSPSKTIETYNFDQMRFYNNIKFIEPKDAIPLLKQKFVELFGDRLKSLIVNAPYDSTKDKNYEFLKQNTNAGSIPEFIINQHWKSKLAYNAICEYEKDNGKYDVIIKSRFDNLIVPEINYSNYDFTNTDLYIPNIHGPIYYDWTAIGNRKGMGHYLSLYDRLGFTLESGRVYFTSNEDVTMSSEHHVCELVRRENLNCKIAPNQTHIYRYNSSNSMLDLNFLRTMNLGDVNLRSYTMEAVSEYKL